MHTANRASGKQIGSSNRVSVVGSPDSRILPAKAAMLITRKQLQSKKVINIKPILNSEKNWTKSSLPSANCQLPTANCQLTTDN
jgi:hypothetical protein